MNTAMIEKLKERMNTDAVLIQPSFELEFLTGFTPMLCERFQGLFIKRNGEMFYLCEDLYFDELVNAYKDSFPIYHYHDNEGMEKVYEILKENGIEKCSVAVNSSAQAFNCVDIAKNCQLTLSNGKDLLEEIRIIKTHEELDLLRHSASIADSVFEEACKIIRPGISEGEVFDRMVAVMEGQGGYDCDCIVGSGPNSSYPHYMGRSRIIEKGDAIVLDWGCHYKGLMSDMSRTVFVGEVSDKQKEVYDLVNSAQRKAELLIHEGVWIPDIDKTAREALGEYAHTLSSRVGHGIGYSVHEGPYINQLNKRKLERGMAFSIEPGIYLKDEFGVRVENINIVNEEGNGEFLNKADRSLRVIL